jgi:hypothetical protein
MFKSVVVTAKATGALVHAKAHNLKEEAKIAKSLTEQEYRIDKVVREQERRDAKVLKVAMEIEKVDADILALQERRVLLVNTLNAAKREADDVTSLHQDA